ncbi:NAD(P)H-dependent flavin oxidoreductase [Marinobacterium marinum]|uniref:Nitronate monooxygenase n=1 Tax=Marinobacterium marinum TaxID=2756129 RepID=A0A7W1WX75_9GAMM|nr:nitronate monooxygenase [Marinobacterium marinum]MBA4501818.1 nitronate monooxygenase [Marinobacterium marinum]
MNRLTNLFNIDLPLIQAPMAGVQGWELAAAVTLTGGLGSLPCATLTPGTIRDAVHQFRQHSSGSINLNFFSHTSPSQNADMQKNWLDHFRPYYEEWGIPTPSGTSGPGRRPFDQDMADLVEEVKPAVVSFHFGLPEPRLLSAVQRSGAKIISSATTVEEALWLEAHEVDAIIAQGLEAGGHRGMFLSQDINAQAGTFALLPQVVEAVRVPVIAAGGIADAAGVRAAMTLGASGVQVGTAYLLCPEARTSAIHRTALSSEAARHTALTNIFSGRPARGIVNRMIRELGPIHPSAPPFPLATAASAPLRAAAEARGADDFTPLWAGQNVSGCRPIPAADITRGLAEGFAALR